MVVRSANRAVRVCGFVSSRSPSQSSALPTRETCPLHRRALPEIPKTCGVLLRSPTVEDLAEKELDVDLIPEGQINMSFSLITPLRYWKHISD